MSDTAPWEDYKPAAAPMPAAGGGMPWEDFKPAAPRAGAAAIPTEAEAAGKPYVAPAPVAPRPAPTAADRVKGVVEAGINTATGVIGALLGSVSGTAESMQQGLGVIGSAVARKAKGLPPEETPERPNLEQLQAEHTTGISGALKRTVTGPMDLREAQTPDSETGQQYTEALGPVMENLMAAAPLHGTMGPKGGAAPALQAAGDVRRGYVAPVTRAGAEAAGEQVGKAARKVLPIDPELAKVAQLASEQKYPIDVRPDQIIEGAKFSKLVGQGASDVPLSGSKKSSNQVAFTRNLIDMLNPEESKADRLTPEVFDQAMTRSGEGIGEITARTPVPETDIAHGVESVRNSLSKATEDNRRIVGEYIGDIQRAAAENDGVLDGTRLKEINSEIGKQARSNADNDLGRYLNNLQDVIQDSVERNAKPEDIQPLRDFRRQYAYGKMVEPLVAKTIDGKVSPAGLMARVTATKQGKHYMARSMGGPIGDLAKVGQLIKEPGSSGTAERGLVYGSLLGGGAYVEPHTAAATYGAAAAYNTLGPSLTRAMIGKRAKKAPPAPPAPPAELTTSPGAGPGAPRGGGAAPGPLGDLTPDWETTPGAGGGAARGGHEPGLVPAVGEKPITRFVPERKAETPSKRAGSEIPAVPGRPDLPDTLRTGQPKETAATERANRALDEPGAQEAMRRAELARREEARKEIPVGEVSEGQPEIKTEKPGKIPVGKVIEGQPEIKAKTPKKLPTGEATEITPEKITLGEKKLPVGEATELTPELIEADKKWRTDHKLGEEDAGRARDVARALGYDEKAVEAAARQHDNSPRAFDREIARINEEGQVHENESNQAARSSESDAGRAGAPSGRDRAAPVRVGEGDGDGSTPVREGAAQPEPAAAVRTAAEQPGADRAAAPAAGRGGSEPAGRQGQVERVRAATKPISHDEALKLVSGKTEKPGGVDPARMLGASVENGRELRHGDVPLDAIRANEEGARYDGTVDMRRAAEYAERGGEMPPVLLVEGRSGDLNVNDGGHRVTAARLRGDETIPAIVAMRKAPNGVEIREVPGGFEAYKDGKKVGYLKDNLERGQAEQLGESANVDMVKVDKDVAGQGVGRALYEAFNEKHGGRILPSGKTEPSAWKLWKRNYPEKVDQFVKDEAQRIRDGADPGLVARNITDAEVRARVLKESERGPGPKPDTQPGGVRQEAGQEGLPEDRGLGKETSGEEGAQELGKNSIGPADTGSRSVGPERQTEAEFGAPRQAAHILGLERELSDARKGKVRTGPFTQYKSKADAIRQMTAALDRARADKPERYASDHLAEINKAIREGKTPSAENIKRYQL